MLLLLTFDGLAVPMLGRAVLRSILAALTANATATTSAATATPPPPPPPPPPPLPPAAAAVATATAAAAAAAAADDGMGFSFSSARSPPKEADTLLRYRGQLLLSHPALGSSCGI